MVSHLSDVCCRRIPKIVTCKSKSVISERCGNSYCNVNVDGKDLEVLSDCILCFIWMMMIIM